MVGELLHILNLPVSVDGPGWLGGDSRMGLDTIAVDVARGGAGVDGPGWLGRDSRIGLDTIAVDVARGGAGVDIAIASVST